jgi:quercetin dioxygenase-like cupin family protein
MDIRTIEGREARPDHSGSASAWYMFDREEFKAETTGTHLEYIVEFEIKAGGQLEHHFHNNWEWFYVMRGEGTMIIEGEEAHVAPGALITIGPNQVHSLIPQGDEPIHCFCFGLNLSKEGSAYFEPESVG